jgi:hypothetical protein
MVPFDRFEFEQDLMKAWCIVDDLRDLSVGVLEHDMTKDQITNVLMGLETLYQLRFERILAQFERAVNQRKL